MNQQDELAASLGVKPEVLAASGVADILQKLPASVHETYRGMKPEHKKFIAGKLSGTTKVLFMTVNNRDAFVKGSVAGVSVFDKMEGSLRKNADRYNLDAAAQRSLFDLIEHFRAMTPAQRGAVASLLDADAKTL